MIAVPEGGAQEKSNASRLLVWSLITPDVLTYLTVEDTLALDTAAAEKEIRDYLVDAYCGLRSPGFDAHVFHPEPYDITEDISLIPIKGDEDIVYNYKGINWVRKRNIDIRDLKLETLPSRRNDFTEDTSYCMLAELVLTRNGNLANYFAMRSSVRFSKLIDRKYGTITKACNFGYVDVVKCLLDRRPEPQVEWKSLFSDTSLLESVCACNGNPEIIKALIDSGEDVSAHQRSCPLYSACTKGFTDAAQLLLDAGADVNYQEPQGSCYEFETVLLGAIREQQTEVVKVLLDHPKIKVNLPNSKNETPLFRASELGLVAIVEALLAAPGIDVDRANNEGETPLFWAVFHSHTEVVRALISAGARAETNENPKAWTHLCSALGWGAPTDPQTADIVALLREAGA